jgi:Domain of unknown function (DUF4149)
MLFLRLAAVLALAFWIGGLAALGLSVAPVLFDVLQAHDPSAGRETAGLLFGTVFERFQYAAWGAGAAVLLSLGLRAALGPRPRRFGVRLLTASLMLAAGISSVFLIAPRIETIRSGVAGPVAALPEADPRRVAFGRWHGLSSALMLLTIVAGAGLIWVELQDQH